MSRLPVPGKDDNVWGTILNDFLSVGHNPDGTLKMDSHLSGKADDNAVVHTVADETIGGVKTFTASPIAPAPTLATHVATKAYVDDVAMLPDADGDTKGKIQLAGDLGGTATAPTVPMAVKKGDFWVNVKDHGAKGDGITDDTAAIQSALDALPPAGGNAIGGGIVYFPAGIYLVNGVSNGVMLSLTNIPNVTLKGTGNVSRIRTTSAVANELLRMETCTQFAIQDLSFQVIGTARINHVIHITSSSPGSVHLGQLNHVAVTANGTYRKAYDGSSTAGSPIIYSAQAAFAPSDVGGVITLNFGDVLTTSISAVATLSSALASPIASTSATSISLTTPLSGAPASGFTIRIGTERMFVTAGGNTTTLTVTRGRGPDLLATTHSAGATVVTYRATLTDNAPATVANASVPMRIEPANTAHMLNGISIATDHPGASNLDVANTSLVSCSVTHAARAGVQVGNGTSGNVLDQWAYGLSISQSAMGVYATGGFLSIHGGDFSLNLIDYKRYQPVSQEAEINGIRTESPAMFYDFQGNATGGSATRISSVQVRTYNSEDGVVMRHLNSGSLTLMSIDINSSTVARGTNFITVAGTPSSPAHLVAMNVAYSGGNNDLFQIGPPMCYRTILGVPRMNAASMVAANTVVGFQTDLRMHVNGGFIRGRTAVADVNYTVLTSDSTVAYTALTAARIVTLPVVGPTLPAGQEFTIKDESGSCDGSRTITITPPSGTIDGAANLVLNAAYARAVVYTNGTNWFTR